jgi:hypothetical protein
MRGRISFTGSDAEEFRLSTKAQEIVDTLWDVLDAGIALYDADKRTQHCAMSRGDWFSFEIDKPERPDDSTVCVIDARINERWTLTVMSRRGLHHDAGSIVRWAADMLALHLPRRGAQKDEAVPPPAGGGGSGGSAEAGIPVWWTRKTRGN